MIDRNTEFKKKYPTKLPLFLIFFFKSKQKLNVLPTCNRTKKNRQKDGAVHLLPNSNSMESSGYPRILTLVNGKNLPLLK